jgi:hypothetical protein
MRPCEHRLEWYWGRLCLACENTGWRKATKKELKDGLAFDPYLDGAPRSADDTSTAESTSSHADVTEHVDVVTDVALTPVERAANKTFGERMRWLAAKLNPESAHPAPEHIREGAKDRDPRALEWLAKRMPDTRQRYRRSEPGGPPSPPSSRGRRDAAQSAP